MDKMGKSFKGECVYRSKIKKVVRESSKFFLFYKNNYAL